MLPRSISSVTAASAPSQQQATAVSRDDERSTGAFHLQRCTGEGFTGEGFTGEGFIGEGYKLAAPRSYHYLATFFSV